MEFDFLKRARVQPITDGYQAIRTGPVLMLMLLQSSFTVLLGAVFVVLFLIITVMCIITRTSRHPPEPFSESYQIAKPVPLFDEQPQQPTRILPIVKASSRATTTPQKSIPGVAESLSAVKTDDQGREGGVKITRGGEFIGNRMRFKAKVINESQYTITDVKVYLLTYPQESLRLTGEDDRFFSKIEPGGFRSPTFDFLPTQDCVKGNVVAGVSFMDMRTTSYYYGKTLCHQICM